MRDPSPGQSDGRVYDLDAVVKVHRASCDRRGSWRRLSDMEYDAIVGEALRSRAARTPLTLMDAGVATAARLSADVRISGRRQDFDLPIWRDNSGDLRIGLPKIAPEHAGDMDQLVLDVGELLAAVGEALQRVV